ncbi:DUF397 domain-containing protein [Actinomadura viridis]|uniref:DUF397 domain-containing protein n=1 Tax=Actinomadura viridis TaxID=58110 RepID=UPI0036955D7D
MTTPRARPGARWRKSVRSSGEGQCVEVASLGGAIGVRDSKAPAAGHLALSPAVFAELVERVRRDELDPAGPDPARPAPAGTG